MSSVQAGGILQDRYELIAEAKDQVPAQARELLEVARSESEAMGVPIYAERIEARLKELGGQFGLSAPG